MSSIQSALLSQPLPLADAMPGSNTKPRVTAPDMDKAVKDFESVFASMMLKEMRKTLESGSFFAEDPSDVYGGLFDQFLGEHIGGAGGLGMSRMIRDALNREVASSQKPTDAPAAVH